MNAETTSKERPPGARQKLLAAAMTAIRKSGFSATSVDDLCRLAGVTKGAFFHHFASKEALGVATADEWSKTIGEFFLTAPYHAPADPLERVLGYVDFRKSIPSGVPRCPATRGAKHVRRLVNLIVFEQPDRPIDRVHYPATLRPSSPSTLGPPGFYGDWFGWFPLFN